MSQTNMMMSFLQEQVAHYQKRAQHQQEDENETRTLHFNSVMEIVNDNALPHRESVTQTAEDKFNIPALRLLTKTISCLQLTVRDDNNNKPRKQQRKTRVRSKSIPNCRWENGLKEIEKSVDCYQDSIMMPNQLTLSHCFLTSKVARTATNNKLPMLPSSSSKADIAPRLPNRRTQRCPSQVHDLINILDEVMLMELR